MAGHRGLINTGFYFGVRKGGESGAGAAFCIQGALQGRSGAAATQPDFAAPTHGAPTFAALLKLIRRKKQFNSTIILCVWL